MTLKKRLQDGETVHGCWLNMGSSVSAEIVSGAGFDWLLIDLEHGFQTDRDVLPQLQAMRHSGVLPCVRVESNQLQRVQKVLDTGAMGVMFPRLYTLEAVRQSVAALKYPPGGIRGIAKMIRASDYGNDFDSYQKNSENILGIIQVETRELLEQAEDLAAIDGVDILFTGPNDLSMALGVFGQYDHPDYVDAVSRIGQAAKKHGKTAGVLLQHPSQYAFYFEKGCRFIACSSDLNFLNQGAKSMADFLKEQHKTLVGK
ncbi:HpcH/HpaI aldolase/citrate lyase family protein [Bacteroidota bacterium]